MAEFRRRKARTFFSLFDLKKKGVMSKDDWVDLAIRFNKFETGDKQKAEHLKTVFANVWEQYFRHSEKKAQYTRDEFADAIERQRFDPDLIKSARDAMRGFFDVLDVNRDGYLQEDEHLRIFTQFGVEDASFTREVFKAIDTNGDEKLSYEEFMNAVFDFLFSEDEKSPIRHFFGPLVD